MLRKVNGVLVGVASKVDSAYESVTRSASAKLMTGASAVGLGSLVQAASVDYPANAEADATGTATNGGNFMIAVGLTIVGFLILWGFARKAK